MCLCLCVCSFVSVCLSVCRSCVCVWFHFLSPGPGIRNSFWVVNELCLESVINHFHPNLWRFLITTYYWPTWLKFSFTQIHVCNVCTHQTQTASGFSKSESETKLFSTWVAPLMVFGVNLRRRVQLLGRMHRIVNSGEGIFTASNFQYLSFWYYCY